MTKFENLCHICGVAPKSEEGKSIMVAVNEMIFSDTHYTDDEIIASVGNRFRKPTTKTVYDFIIFFDDGEAQHRFVVASSEEEATEKLESNLRELTKQGFQYPRFITNPIVEISNVII